MLLPHFLLIIAAAHLALAFLGPRSRRTPINNLLESHYYQGSTPGTGDGDPIVQYIELPVDHFGNNSETFMNRYYVDDYYYKPGGPVFLYDSGEGTADGLQRFVREGATGDLAREYNALMILWEHRFYGTSLPNTTSDMKFTPSQMAEYFRFHKIEQALEDLSVFTRQFSFSGLADEDLRPGSRPWVLIGGSYPGSRAAWSRIRDPEVWHAALASSATVQLGLEMWEYWIPVEEFMPAAGYGNCTADIRAMSRYVDHALEKGDMGALDKFMANVWGPEWSVVYRLFNDGASTDPKEQEWMKITGLGTMLSYIFWQFQSYGMRGYLGLFCDTLQFTAHGGDSLRMAYSDGVFADNAENPDRAVEMYAYALREFWEEVVKVEDFYIPESDNSTADVPYDCGGAEQDLCMLAIVDYSWSWQICSEIGGFQIMLKSRPESLLPYMIESTEYWINWCVHMFGDSVANGPDWEPLDKYGGWNMNPSNVFFSDGEWDPLRAITLNSEQDDAPKRPKTTVIPKSGETPGGTTFFGMVVEGGFHAPDLGWAWNTTGLEAHEVFKSALGVWLPAFVKHEVGERTYR